MKDDSQYFGEDDLYQKTCSSTEKNQENSESFRGPNGITAINIGDIRSHSAQRIKISEVTLLMINKISMVSCPCFDI